MRRFRLLLGTQRRLKSDVKTLTPQISHLSLNKGFPSIFNVMVAQTLFVYKFIATKVTFARTTRLHAIESS